MKYFKGTKIRRPMTPADVVPKVVAKVSIPRVAFDEQGTAHLSHTVIDLLHKKPVGRPKKA